MSDHQIFAAALLFPLGWLALYALLLIGQVRVRESFPVAGLKLVVGALVATYGWLALRGEALAVSLPRWPCS